MDFAFAVNSVRTSIMKAAVDHNPPYIGALLRLGVIVARKRLLAGLSSKGYLDLTVTHLPVFAYPFPDGVRPSELAQRTNQSKQSMNHVLSELERKGYVRRKALRAGEHRLVYLSRKGLTVVEICQREMLALQADLARRVGQKRFDIFLAVLRELAAGGEPVEAESVPVWIARAASKRSCRLGFDRRQIAAAHAPFNAPSRGRKVRTTKAGTRG